MDNIDLRVIFWIIIGLIYLFGRGKKKAPLPPRRQEEPAPDPGKAMTFEELLREIEGMKKVEPEPMPRVEPVPAHQEARKQPLEDATYDYRNEDKIYQVYEEARQQAFLRPSLEETMKVEDTIVRYKQFKNYQRKTTAREAEALVHDLKNPSTFRRAFLISEVLKPKF